MPQQKQNEISLARQAAAGDAAAFASFAESIRHRLVRYSRMVCRQHEDAEEVVQETMLQLFQSIGNLRDPQVVHAWVFRIAFNNCQMKRRKGVHEPAAVESLEASAESAFACPDEHASPEAFLLSAESLHAAEQSIAALPDSYRTVVILRCLEGLSTEETAEILETTPDVVRARLSRARSAMRQHLAPQAEAKSN